MKKQKVDIEDLPEKVEDLLEGNGKEKVERIKGQLEKGIYPLGKNMRRFVKRVIDRMS